MLLISGGISIFYSSVAITDLARTYGCKRNEWIRMGKGEDEK